MRSSFYREVMTVTSMRIVHSAPEPSIRSDPGRPHGGPARAGATRVRRFGGTLGSAEPGPAQKVCRFGQGTDR